MMTTYSSLDESSGLVESGEIDVQMERQSDFAGQFRSAVVNERDNLVRSSAVVECVVNISRRQFLGQSKSKRPAVRSRRDALDFLLK